MKKTESKNNQPPKQQAIKFDCSIDLREVDNEKYLMNDINQEKVVIEYSQNGVLKYVVSEYNIKNSKGEILYIGVRSGVLYFFSKEENSYICLFAVLIPKDGKPTKKIEPTLSYSYIGEESVFNILFNHVSEDTNRSSKYVYDDVARSSGAVTLISIDYHEVNFQIVYETDENIDDYFSGIIPSEDGKAGILFYNPSMTSKKKKLPKKFKELIEFSFEEQVQNEFDAIVSNKKMLPLVSVVEPEGRMIHKLSNGETKHWNVVSVDYNTVDDIDDRQPNFEIYYVENEPPEVKTENENGKVQGE